MIAGSPIRSTIGGGTHLRHDHNGLSLHSSAPNSGSRRIRPKNAAGGRFSELPARCRPDTMTRSQYTAATTPHCTSRLHATTRRTTQPIAAFFRPETLAPDEYARRMQPEAGSPTPTPTCQASAHSHHTKLHSAADPARTTRPIAAFSRLETLVSDDYTRRMQREAGSPSRSPRCRHDTAPMTSDAATTTLHTASRLRTAPREGQPRPIATFFDRVRPVSDILVHKM